jgi:hypothetical protein
MAMAEPDAVRDAWQIHAALSEWTGRADAKASFALTIESAALTVIAALSGPHQRIGSLHGFWALLLLRTGVALIALALLAAVAAVLPRGGPKAVRADWQQNYIYFGHIRHWDPDLLAEKLSQNDSLAALARQLVVMSEIVWRKHRYVRWSLVLAALGAALVTLAGTVTTGS